MASWFLPIAVSALCLGVYDLCKKHAVRDNSVMPVLFFATLCGSFFFVALSLWRGEFAAAIACDFPAWMRVLVKTLIVAASWCCGYYALRELPISLAAPIRATSPLWTFSGGLFLYHEIPTLPQGLSMALVFAGYYYFTLLGKLEGFSWRRSRGLHLIIAATLLGAVSALYDKYLLNSLRIPRETVQLWFSLDLVLVLGAVYFIRGRCFPAAHKFIWRWTIPLTGVLLIIADYAYFYAVSLPDIQISVLSLIRRASCIVTFVAGVYCFREKYVTRKACALAVVLAGIAGLALWK